MISYLSGTIHQTTQNSLILMTPGGVGYSLTVTKKYAANLRTGQELSLPTYLRVTDTDLALFGFQTEAERDFFLLLLTVSGVGPKSAMNILGLGNIPDIQAAIARADVKYLTAVQGLGKKTAERLVTELKTKVAKLVGVAAAESVSAELGSKIEDALSALVAMGYDEERAREAVLDDQQVLEREDVQQTIKRALQYLAK